MPKRPSPPSVATRVAVIRCLTDYELQSGERFWARVDASYSIPGDVEVYVYKPFWARLADAWDVLWGEARR